MFAVRVSVLCYLLCMSSGSVEEENPEFWRSSAQNTLRSALSRKLNSNVAKNIVLFLGDGMGVTTITAARILKGQLQNRSGEETVMNMDTFPFVGLAKVYTVDFQIPDSAATATAYLCGVKTNLNTVGVSAAARNGVCRSQKGNEVTSILKWAKDAGKSVGIVTTTRVQHATPAASYAHSASRTWYSDADLPTSAVTGGCMDIASQLLRNTDIDPGDFGLIVERDPSMDPSISEPQVKPFDPKKNPKGFSLLVEGCRAMSGINNFDQGGPEKTEIILMPGDFGLIVERDPSMDPSISEPQVKPFDPKKNPKGFSLLVEGKSPIFAMDLLPYTTLMYGNGPGHKITNNKRPDIRNVDTTDKDYVQQAAVPLDSETHGGEDVALFARGPMAHLFQGVYEQNYIAHAMAFAACVGTNQEHCAATAEPDKTPFTSIDPGSSAPNTPFGAMTTVMLSITMSVLLH
ncbi:hypothetical protein cypCar_00039429 [Cyprinus carpio]|nr:hypothetical protein cypCar_00039429 [Cyprinus carpio]